MTVPFVDLRSQYAPIQEAIEADVLDVLRSWWVVGGPYLSKFEEEFAAFNGVEHAIGVSSGTSALEVVLRSLNIGPGDLVVVPANTFIATAYAVSAVGATPVFVDVCEDTYLLDPEKVAAVLRTRKEVKAIIPVHLYGQMADMEAFTHLARWFGVSLIEDAAQAIGAQRDNIKIGQLSDAACTSFYPAKNLGTCGQGGAVLTNNSNIASFCRQYIDQGSVSKYNHTMFGHNHRLDSIKAAQLRHALKELHGWNASRRWVAARYDKAFGSRAPAVANGAYHVYHLYEYRCDSNEDREGLMAHLGLSGVACGLHYPRPAFDCPGYSGEAPITDKLTTVLLSLPIFPTMTDDQVDQVINAVQAFRS